MKIYETEKEDTAPCGQPGSIVLSAHKDQLKVATSDGMLNIKVLQLEGKKRMRQIGNVEIPQAAFMSVLKLDDKK